MADQFDPTQFGAIAVEEAPKEQFDPTSVGAVQVEQPAASTAPTTLENAVGAAGNLTKSMLSGIARFPEFAYRGAKIATGITPPAEAAREVLKEAVPIGVQEVKGLQAPVGSQEWFEAIGQGALMATPGLELVRQLRAPSLAETLTVPPVQAGGLSETLGFKEPANPESTLPTAEEITQPKGVSNASQITSTEGIPQPEIRPQVGEEAPLRQSGEVAAARQGVEAGPETVPEEPVKPLTDAETKELDAFYEEEGTPKTSEEKARYEDLRTRYLTSQERPATPPEQAAPAAAAAPPTPTEPAAVQAAAEPPPEIPTPVRGSGKFRQTYQVDKELGDRMESIGASRESGALRAEIASRKVTDELTPEQESDLGKYLVSQRLKTVNPEHPQVLSPEETARIESDPAISKAIYTYKTEVKPEIEALRKQAGLSEEAAAGKEPEFISLIKKPAPEVTGGAVPQASKLGRKTRFAQKAEGQAAEYDTDLRNVLEQSYTEVTRKARVAEFYRSVQRKGLAEPSTVYTAKGPRSAVTFDDLPPELQHDLRAASEQELRPSGLAKGLQAYQRFTTGVALTANPAELMNHMRRQLNLVAAKPPIGRGPLARLEAVVPYIGPKLGTFARTITDNMSKPENMAVLQDIFDAGGGSSRSFTSMYKSNIPGVRQLQTMTHDLLFGIPKGKGIGGWDLRMRVQLEKIRRAAEGNTDPQRIREFANQIGQYGTHPDWIVRGLRTINPYAATTLPMRLTELKTAVGKSDLQAGGGGAVGRTAETLLRGTGGTLLGLASANYLLSGKFPWDNDEGHEFDLNTGLKGEGGKTIYMKFRVVAPELARPVGTAALPNISRETTSKKPQYLSAFLTGLANQGLSLVSGPAQNALLTALTGKAPYITKAPGARPEVMDIAKTEKGKSRGLEQIKHAATAVNPLGTALVEEPYHTNVPSPLKYVEQPLPGIRPFGSVFTQTYEKKQKPGKSVIGKEYLKGR